jgi:acetyl-CoA synthetase
MLNFWGKTALKYLHWQKKWLLTQSGDFQNLPIEWFVDGQTNASYNCIDKHLPQHANKTAIIWEGNEPSQSQYISYQELHDKTCQMANLLKSFGIKKGDVVCIYLPMIPEAIYAMLACARIGAIHNVIFGGFSSQALENRINDSNTKLIITANHCPRGGKVIAFKENVDAALKNCPSIQNAIVIKHLDHDTQMQAKRDHWYHELINQFPNTCEVEWVNAQDPLFILYTSGSTGKPKGIVHATGGYLTYVALSYDHLFQHQPHKIHWCTADIGWITGHSYMLYGPLINAATTVMYEGVPNYPDFSRYWQIIDKHQIHNFYTAPTVLRSLRHEGEHWIKPQQLKSLELLGSVGEPINPDVWQWYFDKIGQKRCPIINTWWQTETGGVLLSAEAILHSTTPGSVGKPFQGIETHIDEEGMLYIRKPWPGMMKTIFNDDKRFQEQYFSTPEKGYLTGDSAYQLENEEFVVNGRLDDVIKVSGHRLGSEEIESAAVSHPLVNEAAAIGIPHDIKGEGIVVYVVCFPDTIIDNHFNQKLTMHLREQMGPIATAEAIVCVPDLPKTRSGKIMRRILKKIAMGDYENLGDISTLANPEIIETIINKVKKL